MGEFRDLREPKDFWDPLSSNRELNLCFLTENRFYKSDNSLSFENINKITVSA